MMKFLEAIALLFGIQSAESFIIITVALVLIVYLTAHALTILIGIWTDWNGRLFSSLAAIIALILAIIYSAVITIQTSEIPSELYKLIFVFAYWAILFLATLGIAHIVTRKKE